MPALRMTEQQRREKALRVAVSRGKEERGYRHDMDVADAIGVNKSTYYRYRRESFQQMADALCKAGKGARPDRARGVQCVWGPLWE